MDDREIPFLGSWAEWIQLNIEACPLSYFAKVNSRFGDNLLAGLVHLHSSRKGAIMSQHSNRIIISSKMTCQARHRCAHAVRRINLPNAALPPTLTAPRYHTYPMSGDEGVSVTWNMHQGVRISGGRMAQVPISQRLIKPVTPPSSRDEDSGGVASVTNVSTSQRA